MDILNSILAGVSNGLYKLYPELDIFSEFVPEELPDRCFLIGFAGEPIINKHLGERYKITGKIDIAYFVPKKAKELNEEFNKVFCNLAFELQNVEYEGIRIRLFSHERQVVDEVLHDICSFESFVVKVDNSPMINNISVNKEGVE
ncbi:hypothetical protein Q428_08705 [Fervidicella metallireducens AeB]|uniref:Uncharacterized protein n=1 Tax=Fervidicella metallireducens AeB TaxID=1403537 RepID=A0A017RWF8_9CLOT|nr:hypothetical protein [Fervidicella metallireducens]EYE88270.1 hypothetical protein Q428_08705 [Fervidicella metallireducens AeB]